MGNRENVPRLVRRAYSRSRHRAARVGAAFLFFRLSRSAVRHSLLGYPPDPVGFPEGSCPQETRAEAERKRPRFRDLPKSGAPTHPKKTRGRAGSPTRAARAFSFFRPVAPPYPKGGVYGVLVDNGQPVTPPSATRWRSSRAAPGARAFAAGGSGSRTGSRPRSRSRARPCTAGAGTSH